MKVIRLGIIGLSEGNGHPYSFSAIINGYDRSVMSKSEWIGIYNYLEEKDPAEFLIGKAQVTHVWTQEYAESEKIARATKIKTICKNKNEMIGQVDGVIIARDDYEVHFEFAKPFLEAGIKVFMDKPLSLNTEELRYFLPYMHSGQLMSCSGLRYAGELDPIRSTVDEYQQMKLIRGAVLNSWEKYGVHMLDAIFNIVEFDVSSVQAVSSHHMSVLIKNRDGLLIEIDALEDTVKTFQLDFWSSDKRFHAEIGDNFTAFKRTLYHFIRMIETDEPQIDPALTMGIMKVLIAANLSQKENREVFIDEILI